MGATRRFQLPTGALLCRAELFGELAEQAESGYRRAAWGGVETGGLLLGRRRGDRIIITETRPIECDHEFGPAFHLSPADRGNLQLLLDATALTRTIEVLGWYYTTSHDLQMDGECRSLDQEFFVQPWQVALVIQRGRKAATKFGLFAKGKADPSHPVLSFTLAELPKFPEETESQPAPETVLAHETAARAASIHDTSTDTSTYDTPIQGVPIHVAPTPPAQPPVAQAVHEPGPFNETVIVPESIEASLPAYGERANPAPFSIGKWPRAARYDTPLEFFGFRYDPFFDQPDPAFYCDCPSHREVLASLGYGVWSRKGVLLLTGETGLGKTMLLRCLAQDLKKDGTQSSLLSPAPVSVPALCQSIAKDLDLTIPASGKTSLPIALWARGTQNLEQGRNLAILVDDAHLLDSSVLAELEALSTFGTRREKLVQLVMTADRSIEDRLGDPSLRAFAQQITVRAKLSSLDAGETATYIDARLARAGVTPGLLFPPDAVAAVFDRSAGVPREINAVCNAALNAAYERRQAFLTGALVANALFSSPVADPEDQTAQAIG